MCKTNTKIALVPPDIYQIYYSKTQQSLLDPCFIPYDNGNSASPELREYAVFKAIYDAKLHEKNTYVGALSWKFKQKTALSGGEFIQFMHRNPGYDVYFINPYPKHIKFSSTWAQGQKNHPEMLRLTQFVLDQLNYPIQLNEIKNDLFTTAYCNFWVGNENFWEKYMAFTLPIYHYILNESPAAVRNLFLVQQADKITDAPYFPYVFERLFSLFLVTQNDIKYKTYDYSFNELRDKYSFGTAFRIYLKFLRGK